MSGETAMWVRKQPGGGYVVEGSGREAFPATAVSRFEEVAGVLRRAFGEREPLSVADVMCGAGRKPVPIGDVALKLEPFGDPPPGASGFVAGDAVEWNGVSDVLTGFIKSIDTVSGWVTMENGLVVHLKSLRHNPGGMRKA